MLNKTIVDAFYACSACLTQKNYWHGKTHVKSQVEIIVWHSKCKTRKQLCSGIGLHNTHKE